jgi:hypothetical protein
MNVKSIGRLYHRIKTWLVALAIAAPLILHYAPLPAEWERNALPIALACAFGIVVELLFSIDNKVNRRAVAKQYGSFTEAIPDILNLVSRRKQGKHVIKVLASTGGTTVATLLPQLLAAIHRQHLQIDFRIILVNPESPLLSVMPTHWAREMPLSVERLRNFAEAGADEGTVLTCSKYAYVPCLRGVLIDDIHLFAGFFAWSGAGADLLSGAEQPHFYLRRDTTNAYLFQVWDGWFSHAPSVRVFPDNDSGSAGRV